MNETMETSNDNYNYYDYFIKQLETNIDDVYLLDIKDKLNLEDIDKFLLEYENCVDNINDDETNLHL